MAWNELILYTGKAVQREKKCDRQVKKSVSHKLGGFIKLVKQSKKTKITIKQK